ncbi:hypothetical protein B0H14DRAFT_2607162 [Mycena olivaceomarginata]|nr:hypothetical protein B0H14DRAFT_2607162 [Mycena olivaceomarginata]
MAPTKTNRKGLCQQEPRRAPPKPNVFRAPSPSPTPSVADSSFAGLSIPAETPPLGGETSQESHSRPGVHRSSGGSCHRKEETGPIHPSITSGASTTRGSDPSSCACSKAHLCRGTVGLDPEAIQVDLQEHFSPCGEIEYVNFRYSSSGVPGHPQLGYCYAIIKFATAAAANAVVDLTGSKLMGSDYSLVVEPDLLGLPEVQKLPEFLKAARAQHHMLGGLPQHEVLAVRPDHKLQTASGMTVTSPVALIARTKVWKTSEAVVRKKKNKHSLKEWCHIVGGVSFKMTCSAVEGEVVYYARSLNLERQKEILNLGLRSNSAGKKWKSSRVVICSSATASKKNVEKNTPSDFICALNHVSSPRHQSIDPLGGE